MGNMLIDRPDTIDIIINIEDGDMLIDKPYKIDIILSVVGLYVLINP